MCVQLCSCAECVFSSCSLFPLSITPIRAAALKYALAGSSIHFARVACVASSVGWSGVGPKLSNSGANWGRVGRYLCALCRFVGPECILTCNSPTCIFCFPKQSPRTHGSHQPPGAPGSVCFDLCTLLQPPASLSHKVYCGAYTVLPSRVIPTVEEGVGFAPRSSASIRYRRH